MSNEALQGRVRDNFHVRRVLQGYRPEIRELALQYLEQNEALWRGGSMLDKVVRDAVSYALDRSYTQNSSLLREVEAQLEQLGRLYPNWDGFQAPAIDRTIIAAAKKFFRELQLPDDGPISAPQVVPMAGGNLQFEWHAGKRTLELEFETAETIHYLQWDSAAGFEAEDLMSVHQLDRALDLIQWFAAGTNE